MIAAGVCILLAASWIGEALLTRAGLGGTHGRPAILGGLVAGVLLGPSLLGRVAPSVHEDLFAGARSSRERWCEAAAERQAHAAAEHAAGIVSTADRGGERPSEADSAVADLERRWRDESRRDRRPQQVLAVTLAVLVLLASGTSRGTAAPPSGASQGRLDGEPPSRQHHAASHRLDALLIGLWSAGVPALSLLLVLRGHGLPLADAGALWALACVSVGAWALDPTDRAIAENCEAGGTRLVARAATVASAGAALLLAAAWLAPGLASSFASRSAPGLASPPPWWLAAVLVAAIGLGFLVARTGDRGAILATRWGLAPLAALIAVRVELFRDAAPWLILFIMLLAGDGRAAGAFVGAALPGTRRPLRALRLSLVAGAAAPSQLALLAAGALMELLDSRLTLALLAACGLMEATTTVRPRVARSIRELETEADPRANG